MQYKLRAAVAEDLTAIVRLIREFAEFEDLSEYCEVTEQRLGAALFGENAVAESMVALDGEAVIGYALLFPNFSSFRGQRGFYLDDIYITAKYRGTGVGRAILKEIARLADARGYERIDLLVLDWNSKAADFYLSLGAKRDDSERHFKFTDDAFRRLAS